MRVLLSYIQRTRAHTHTHTHTHMHVLLSKSVCNFFHVTVLKRFSCSSEQVSCYFVRALQLLTFFWTDDPLVTLRTPGTSCKCMRMYACVYVCMYLYVFVCLYVRMYWGLFRLRNNKSYFVVGVFVTLDTDVSFPYLWASRYIVDCGEVCLSYSAPTRLLW
jgi:hypothetical protein